MTDRDLLLFVLAELGTYGVTAREALPGDADSAGEELLVGLWRERPNALGSYAFWLRADEACLSADGALRAPLPVYVSEDVCEPLEFLLDREGFDLSGGDPLFVEPVALEAAA